MTRAAFFRLHSWLGIVTGAGMLLIAWSGSLVVFNPFYRSPPRLSGGPAKDSAPCREKRFAAMPRFYAA